MDVELDLTKTAQQNAAAYYEKSKKARKKLIGIEKAIKELEAKIKKASKEEAKVKVKVPEKKKKRQWFEKFRWFKSSDGFLVLGGRDAQSNETLIKKHMDKTDIYFHADLYGAAHCVIKSKDGSAPDNTLNEAAVFAAVSSRAWRDKIANTDVYSVKPDQVSKKSPSGESLGTGAFMIHGKRNWYRKTPLEFAVGLKKNKKDFDVISGPSTAIKKEALIWKAVQQGDQKAGDIAKKLKKIFLEKEVQAKSIDLDDIIRMLPVGGCQLK